MQLFEWLYLTFNFKYVKALHMLLLLESQEQPNNVQKFIGLKHL